MNIHKNARLTYVRRLEMVLQITAGGLTPGDAVVAQGVSATTARKCSGDSGGR
jgi:copper homeostasis protein CutC